MRATIPVMVFAIVVAACAGGDEAGTTTTAATTTSTLSTTTSPTSTSTLQTSTTVPTTTTTTRAPAGGDLVTCDSPEGYTISYPSDWSTNAGDVVPACGQFGPEPFEVPRSDERVAAITVYIDPVSFADVVEPDRLRAADRAVTTIDGLPAVRLQYETAEGLVYPSGTPVTSYAVDLSIGTHDDPQTMIIDTLGLSSFDYERNVTILDRMARTLEIGVEDADAAVVARYQGGGGGFTVEGEVAESEACLVIRPDGSPVCGPLPAPGGVETLGLVDLGEPMTAGVAGERVFRVEAELEDGSRSTFLPAPIGESGVRGFAFVFGEDSVERLVWYDVEGRELGGTERGG